MSTWIRITWVIIYNIHGMLYYFVDPGAIYKTINKIKVYDKNKLIKNCQLGKASMFTNQPP
jgi:uncharacterized membrane protein